MPSTNASQMEFGIGMALNKAGCKEIGLNRAKQKKTAHTYTRRGLYTIIYGCES